MMLRAMNTLAENADVDSLEPELLQHHVVKDGQRAGREFRRFLENGAKLEFVVSNTHLVDCRRASMPEEWRRESSGWKVERHRNMGVQVFDPQSLALFLTEPQKTTRSVQGKELLKLLAEEPVLPDAYLDFLLAHPEYTPESWKGKAVFFWGTIYSVPNGSLCVRFLYWYGGRWYWSYYWLDYEWDSRHPAASLAS